MSQSLTRIEESHEVLQSGSRPQGRGSKRKHSNVKEEWWLLNSDDWWCDKVRRLEICRCAEGVRREAGGKRHGVWSEADGQCQVMDSLNREDRRLMVFAAGLGIFVPLPGIQSEQPSGHAVAAVHTRLDSRVIWHLSHNHWLFCQVKKPGYRSWQHHHASLYFTVKPKNLFSIPGRSNEFFCSERSRWLWGPPVFLFRGYLGLFTGGEAAGVWSWPLSSNNEVKNK